ncbi:HK97 family phage major capsid protein [Pseudonocardia sediminis]|uniref:HK97 family phage major capsid protein n=1 Tax=Pseudonocardia sediminis TaxID=1397368 RepID=A0A4Q7UYC6_PSEST|nr:phage major capsid protein [Pseudonocardia sediminis]RZT87107.1 HK97 family phage major capsid protein [Pseudonocardia sediminis]
MATYTSTTGVRPGLIPEEWIDRLVVEPVAAESVAMNPAVSTTITVNGQLAHIPKVTDDVAANWVAEGAEISPDDAEFSEITVTTRKIAALSIISRELADDTSPSALELIGAGIARSIAKKIDAAFFSEPAPASPAPAGLGSLPDNQITKLNVTAWDSTDNFALADSVAGQIGVTLSCWVANPVDALTLATIKASTDSRVPLLATDPTQPSRRIIEGKPVLISPAVKSGTIWGLPSDRVIVARRKDVTLETSTDAYFSSDRLGIRATGRMGFAFPHTLGIVKLVKTS